MLPLCTNTQRAGGHLETLVSIVGGVGLFLLGMAVMTDGLKALAGTALKTDRKSVV